MKKVFMVILMLVVLMTASVVYADEIAYGVNPDDARELVRTWAKLNDFNDYYLEIPIGNVLYGCGTLNKEEFEKETGKELNVVNFITWAREKWEMCEIRVTKMGEIKDVDIYLAEGQSETTVLGYYNGEYFYCIRALFIMYSTNTK